MQTDCLPKNRKIFLFGTMRECRSIKYVFEGILCFDGIVLSKMIQTENKDSYVIDMQQFKETHSHDSCLVVCGEYPEEFGSSEEILYIELEKLFPYLDEGLLVTDIADKKWIVWGTGAVADRLQSMEPEPFWGIQIEFFVDSDKNKQGKLFAGKIIKNPKAISKGKKYCVLIATDKWTEIVPELKDVEYYVYSDIPEVYPRILPSQLLAETLKEKPCSYGICADPFDRAVVWGNGDISLCCNGIKETYGNVLYQCGSQIWGGVIARIIRLSILNQTYSFCDRTLCSFLRAKNFEPIVQADILNIELKESPQWIQLNFDNTCNLKCISCRNEVFVEKGLEAARKQVIADKLLNIGWLKKSKDKVIIAGAGEVLFSKAYRSVVFSGEACGEEGVLWIGSNGTLLNCETLDKISKLYGNVAYTISIDAATKETYERVRRGGNWENVKENMERLGEMRTRGEVKNFTLTFVVAKWNYFEMVDFVKWAISLHADVVIFRPILNWDLFSKEEFENDVSMLLSDDVGVKKELAEIMKDPIWKTKDIRISIDLISRIIEQGDNP